MTKFTVQFSREYLVGEAPPDDVVSQEIVDRLRQLRPGRWLAFAGAMRNVRISPRETGYDARLVYGVLEE